VSHQNLEYFHFKLYLTNFGTQILELSRIDVYFKLINQPKKNNGKIQPILNYLKDHKHKSMHHSYQHGNTESVLMLTNHFIVMYLT